MLVRIIPWIIPFGNRNHSYYRVITFIVERRGVLGILDSDINNRNPFSKSTDYYL